MPNTRNRAPRQQQRGSSGRAPDRHLAPVDQRIAHNDQAEQAVLGAMLLNPAAIEAVTDIITSGDFWRPAHSTIHAAIIAMWAADIPVNPITLTEWLIDSGDITAVGGAAYLNTLIADLPSAASAPHFARIVAKHARTRRLDLLGTQLSNASTVEQTERRLSIVTSVLAELERVANPPGDRQSATRIDDFLAGPDDEDHDWLVPGLLERTDRVILTGPEGGGKSTFGRQVAVTCAAGMHPFTGEDIKPVRVLILDLENSERQLRRALRPLVLQAGRDRLDPGNLLIRVRLEGLNLHDSDDRAFLDQLLADTKPDLLVTGPIYKMATGDPTEEKHAKSVTEALDKARARHGAALWIEAHTAKGVAGVKKRPIEPYGASLWLRWPEFGVHLSAEGDVEHWRGQREQREWPTLLLRGGKWPWSPSSNELEVRFRQIKNARFAADGPMSLREIEEATRIPKSTVQRVLRHYKHEWAAFNARTPGEEDVA